MLLSTELCRVRERDGECLTECSDGTPGHHPCRSDHEGEGEETATQRCEYTIIIMIIYIYVARLFCLAELLSVATILYVI